MFTIKKSRKIQVYFFHNPSHLEIANSVRYLGEGDSTMINHLVELNKKRVEDIINSNEGISEELSRFGIIELRSYFLAYPSSWYDLKRKIHSHKTLGGSEIKKEKEEDILHVLLRKGRGDNHIDADHIEGIWRKEILQNKELIREISGEPSLLDSSHGQIMRMGLEKEARTQFIQKMIELGLETNHAAGNGETSDKVLERLMPKILEYLKSIFEIDFSQQDIPKKITSHSLSAWVYKKIWHPDEKGVSSKNAWMLVKAIRAWGGYDEISKHHIIAKEALEKLPKKLSDHGIEFEPLWVRKDFSYNDKIDIHHGNATIKKSDGSFIHFQLEYRLKSMRSTLLKLWSDEDYNNIDAFRDMIGIAIIWPDNISEDDALVIAGQCTNLFAHKGYMAKNKGLFSEPDKKKEDVPKERRYFRDILKKDVEKKPLGSVAVKKKGKSSGNFKNAAFSGFTNINGNPTGIEVQFYNQSSYDFWKTDHYMFDPLKVVSAWSRGSWFLTPKQFLNTIRTNIHQDVRETKLKKLPQQIFQDYISSGLVIAYAGSNKEVYIVPKQFEKEFNGKFQHVHAIEKSTPELRNFIRNLSDESTSETSEQTLSQDQGLRLAAE